MITSRFKYRLLVSTSVDAAQALPFDAFRASPYTLRAHPECACLPSFAAAWFI